MTASWLKQMGWEAYVLAERGTDTHVPRPVLGWEEQPGSSTTAHALRRLLDDGAATVVDLSLSKDFRRAHIPGAWYAIRSRLDRALSKVKPAGTLVLTSEDGVLASLAVAEAAAATKASVRWLDGGNAGWVAAGFPTEAGDERMADEPIDAWLKPYERKGGVPAAMKEYLAWEVDLLERIARDGTCRFHTA